VDIANLRAVISVETSRFRAGMAGVEGQLRGTEAQLRAVDAQSRVTGAAMATTGRQSALMATGAKLAKVGLAGVAFAAYEGFKRMKDQERVSAMTANTLKNTANAAGLTQGKVEALAGSLALMTGVSKSTVQGAENILLGFKNVTRDSGTFRQVLQASMDRSAKSGRDLIGVTRAIGMAFNDPIGGMGRLARAGIFLDSTTKEHIKEMTKAGKIDQARALILDKVSGSAKGAAAALGQTTTGQLNRMKEALGQMSEEVARSLLPAILTIGPPLISLVRSLAPAFKMLAQGVAAIAQPFANVLSAITSSRAGTIALTTALGALIALGVGAKIAAWGKGIGQFVGSLTSGVSKIAGFGTAAAAAEAETTAVGGAMGAAGAEAGAMGAVMGGPVVWGILAATAATVAVGAVIGGDLVRSFMGAGSAADQYAEAMRRTKQATSDLHTTTASLPGALDNLAGAHRRVAAARRAADAAPGDLGKQAALKQSIVDEARARDASVAALRRSATANRNAATASEAEVNAAVRAKGIYPGMIGSLVVSEAAHRKYEAAVKRSAQTVGNTTAWKQAQADYASMAAKLQPLGGKYAVVAKEASKLSNMKPGPEATALAATIGKQLDNIAAHAGKTKPKVKVDADTNAAKTKVSDLTSQVTALTSKSWAVNVQVNQIGAMPTGPASATGKSVDELSYDTSRATYRRSPANRGNIAGTFQTPPGILDLIASLKQAGRESVNANAATAAALALNSALSKQAQVATLASRVTSTLGAFTSAKTDKEKAAAKSQALSALTNLYLATGHNTSKKAAQAHAAATLGLVAAHKMGAQAASAHARKTAAKAAQDAAVAAVGWQDQLQAELDAVMAAANEATPAVGDVADAVSGLDDAASAASANLSKAQSLVEKAMQKVRDTLTPTEAAIKSLQDTWASQDIAQSVADAQDALRNAMDFGDADAIRNAQKALNDASRQQRIADLQPVANAERQTVNDFLDNLDPAAIAQQLVDNGGNIAAGATINLTVTDNTFAGLSRDQADRIALSIQAAIGRRVGIAV
jgi:hypothetical protein